MFNVNGDVFLNYKKIMHLVKFQFYMLYINFRSEHLSVQFEVACKRQSSVNSEAWLRRFDDVTRVEKSCIAKSKKEKKVKEKCCIFET